jgi:thiamine biosynthesis lipoprotein
MPAAATTSATWPSFRHEAMATEFEIFIAGQKPEYARQAASAAWRELDRLESELSRYVESSDISRANRLAPGESITIGDDALNCLLCAAEVTAATHRAFDPAYASSHDDSSPAFTLDPDTHTLTARAKRLHLDLGAIGKGYALDRLALVLNEWGVTSACLQSGGSTALALRGPPGHDGWPIGLGDNGEHRTLSLANLALSGSGVAVKGAHLIDPRTRGPAIREQRVWALASDAAVSDALSTAFFVMTDQQIAGFCDAHTSIGAGITGTNGRVVLYGSLAKFQS